MELDGPPRMVGWITWSGRERSSQTHSLPVPGVRLVHPIYKSLFSLVFNILDGDLFHTKALVLPIKTNEYVILSIEPTKLGDYWVNAYQDRRGITEQKSIQTLDFDEAWTKFSNQKSKSLNQKLLDNLKNNYDFQKQDKRRSMPAAKS